MEKIGRITFKEKTAYATAIISFCIGWGLAIAGFIMGKGDIKESVLWVLGQALIYTASVLGVTLYFGNQMAKFKVEAKEYIDQKDNGAEADPEI